MLSLFTNLRNERQSITPNVEALLSGVALAAMLMNKDNQMPCYLSAQ
jgi:hypothetical protein